MTLAFDQMQNSRRQGDAGMGIAIAWFTKHGYCVSIPLTDSQDYDLVIERDNQFSSVQVRTTYYTKPNGIYQLNLRVSGGNRSGTGKTKHIDPDVVDYLFAVTNDGEMYLIPTGAIEARSILSLGAKCDPFRVNL